MGQMQSEAVDGITHDGRTIGRDFQAGLTVALVAIPQCMAFATIAGLTPAAGLYAAVVMGLVGAAVSGTPKLNIGPAVTTSTMVFAILAVAAENPEHRAATAGVLAILVGLFTFVGGLLKIGQFAKFVSRSVLIGLTAGAAILIFGSQLPPFFGVASTHEPTLIWILLDTLTRMGGMNLSAVIMAAATLTLILLGNRFLPRFPMPFVVLLFGGVVVWLFERAGIDLGLQTIGSVPRKLPPGLSSFDGVVFGTDLVVGAGAIAIVAIIQTLAIAKSFATRDHRKIDSRRELLALGLANVATGCLHGFPGAGSFARSGLNDMAGARTRMSGIIAAITVAAIVLAGAPLAERITKPAIAGLLMATAWSLVEWKAFLQIVRRERRDRVVLGIMILCVFVLPIHWAIVIGLSVSIAVFLRRVSRLHLFEMVSSTGNAFSEHQIDQQTGSSAITMLQVEGPLFFAHAEDMADTLRTVFQRRPRVTILRMRRTHQIDYSVVSALTRVAQAYIRDGGTLIICGLTEKMRATVLVSDLGKTIRPRFLLQTTREVFGSAHEAIRIAEEIARTEPSPARSLFRENGPATGNRPRRSVATAD